MQGDPGTGGLNYPTTPISVYSSRCSAEASAKQPVSLTIRRSGRQRDVCPGGHAKWVRCPHGPATVSGERHVADVTGTAESCEPAGQRAWEDRRAAAIRESGNLTLRGVILRRERRRKEPSCLQFVFDLNLDFVSRFRSRFRSILPVLSSRRG